MLIEFELEKYDRNIPIVIWGFRGAGRLLYYILKRYGIEIFAFVEGYNEGDLFGIDIISTAKLKEIYSNNNIIVMIGFYNYEIIEKLAKLNIDRYYDGWNLLSVAKFNKNELSKQDWYLYNFRDYYLYYKMKMESSQKLYVDKVDLVITERCSLKCEACSNLMQYYERPINYELESVKKYFDSFLTRIDYLGDLRIIGGEPFMHPDFQEIIERYRKHNKIHVISIWSNATIFPTEEVRKALKDDKIILRFSDYGALSYSLKQWVEFCEKENVKYSISKVDKWHNLGGLYKRNYNIHMLKQTYAMCECRNSPTFLRGRLYNCPYAANAVNLHAMPVEESMLDYLDFTLADVNYSKEIIKEFLEDREYLMACDYCSGRNYNDGGIEPHVQTKLPLQYKHYE